MSNIDKFQFYSGLILGYLEDKFPVPFNGNFGFDIIKDKWSVIPTNEIEGQEEIEFMIYTLEALRDFGFIQYQSKENSLELENLKLTLKAAEAMNIVNNLAKKTNQELLKEALQTGRVEAIKTVTSEIIKTGLRSVFLA